MPSQRPVAIVTGASRGIGAAIANALAAEGFDLGINFLSREAEAHRVVGSVEAQGAKALAIQADVSDRKQVSIMVQTMLQRFGRLDALVNNAGMAQLVPFLEITDEYWERILAVNLRSVFLCCQAVVPEMMRQGGGRIVNVASMGVRTGGLAGAHYVAAKGGVVAFTRSLAAEVVRFGILVNAVAPPLTATEMGREALAQKGAEAIIHQLPLGRVAHPEEVAAVAAFLCSSRASYITGETFWVSGGR